MYSMSCVSARYMTCTKQHNISINSLFNFTNDTLNGLLRKSKTNYFKLLLIYIIIDLNP